MTSLKENSLLVRKLLVELIVRHIIVKFVTGTVDTLPPEAYPGILFGGGFNKFS